MRVTSHQEDKQTWENCGWVALKKENLKRWKVLGVSKLTYRLEKSSFHITRKNNEPIQPNQKLSEIVVGAQRSEFNNNAKMVSKSFNKVIPWSHFNFIFSDG